ncbi:uncharacterized protein EV420DRAFT_1582222 [Desarmillaria tabescens]|uniref:Secreted protein n=1 Tax=Armillaria tabescens TaxID=1929756 RepID=A0AA39JCG1_ARMTA|nr:uncharacterized protein EV420DRAFT_1582222 [Desarmillaria tabescens]KAK0440211.1 hypothetical protein EV420DRAFT_1582222 [Desarmillaria tabescens]
MSFLYLAFFCALAHLYPTCFRALCYTNCSSTYLETSKSYTTVNAVLPLAFCSIISHQSLLEEPNLCSISSYLLHLPQTAL